MSRNSEITRMVLDGRSLARTGAIFHISRQRVSQIVHQFCKEQNPSMYMKCHGHIHDLTINKQSFIE